MGAPWNTSTTSDQRRVRRLGRAYTSGVLFARTPDEAHLFMDLHPCDCGELQFERRSSLVASGDEMIRVYRGECARCKKPREFRFRLPDRPLLTGGLPEFGDDLPSELLDPGEWMLVADQYATRKSPTHRDLALARAAMFEILKFMSSDDESVPERAFTSARGREVHDHEPGRFRRARLEAVLATYDDLLTKHRG